MQVITIVMLLTYTSLYKIIYDQSKNHRLASTRKAIALPKHNVYIASDTSVDLAVESLEKVGHGGSSTANT